MVQNTIIEQEGAMAARHLSVDWFDNFTIMLRSHFVCMLFLFLMRLHSNQG